MIPKQINELFEYLDKSTREDFSFRATKIYKDKIRMTVFDNHLVDKDIALVRTETVFDIDRPGEWDHVKNFEETLPIPLERFQNVPLGAMWQLLECGVFTEDEVLKIFKGGLAPL